MDYNLEFLRVLHIDPNLKIKEVLKEVINEICPNKRKPKFSIDYYLTNIIHVLKDANSWKSLQTLNVVKGKINHYKTINDKFLEWSKKGIFKEAYKRLLLKGSFTELNKYPNKDLDLFIDSSQINNKGGKELIAHGMNKKKKETKISVITTEAKEIISVTLFSGNISDANTIDESLNNLPKFDNKKKINLIGDKGYIKNINYKDNLNKTKNITLMHPQRSNQKVPTSNIVKTKLKNRYKVEHSLQQLKKFNRISLRKDRLMVTFESFIYLALCFLCKKS